jgi:hypothetical protein
LEALEALAQHPDYKISLESREKLILSALLISHAKSKQNPQASHSNRGEALKQVLDAMGPAGRKLAQAIESHNDTPDDIKEALKDAKTNAAPPLRWELHEWLEENYTPHQQADPVLRMGQMLGAGSYGVTVQVFKQSAAITAVTLLRPNMYEQAQDEFMILNRAAEVLIRKNSMFRSFDDMQCEAAVASRKEVDMDVAKLQQGYAEALYNHFKVTINGVNFEFKAAPWVSHGKRYKETAVIQGLHFNDLAKDLAHQDLVKPTAQAILAAELFFRLLGTYCDGDRHGGQQKIQRKSASDVEIGNFDFGGMSIIKLRDWQKTLLGELVGELLWAINNPLNLRETNFSDKLIQHLCEKYVRKFAQKNFEGPKGKLYLIGDEKAKHFVGGIKRGLLALGNYFSALKDDLPAVKNVFRAVLSAEINLGDKIEKIDPIIETAMLEQIPAIFQSEFDAFKQQSSGISLRRGP